VRTSWATSAAGSLRAGPRHRVAAAEPELDIAPAIAADRQGDALIAWVQGGRPDHVMVALRRAGGRFGRPRSVLAGHLSSVEIAIGDHGRFVIGAVGLPHKRPGAELESDRLEVLRGDVAAGVRHRDLLNLDADFLALDASVAGDGSVALAWWTDLAGETDGTGSLYAATGSAAGPLTVDALATTETSVDDNARPSVLAEPGGRAVAMWHDQALEPSPVMLAENDGGGHLTRIRRLTRCGETGDLARRADGRVLAAWASCVHQTVVRAQSRSPRGAWGRVHTLDRGDVGTVAASFEPVSGRPVVAWVNDDFNRPQGEAALMVAAGEPRSRR
jgi:hypothetical protein